MNIHVLTPFSRIDMKDILVDYYEKFHIIWHPIVYTSISFNKEWIKPYHAKQIVYRDPCYDKLNRWIETQDIVKDDYYCFACDDDGYEDGFFDKVRSLNYDVIVVSIKRGTNPIGFDINTLEAKPENMTPCHCGLQQIVVKGHVLKTIRFQDVCIADGLMIQNVVNSNHHVYYEPNLYAYFNYFQKGRWEK